MTEYWLAKQEPEGPRGYHIDQLKKDKKTVWNNVHNNLALKYMKEMKKGDKIFYYHTGKERQIVGIMEVITKPYPNPKEANPRFIVVDVKFIKKLKKPITLGTVKNTSKFKDWLLVRMSRLSVMPVPKEIWDAILELSNE